MMKVNLMNSPENRIEIKWNQVLITLFVLIFLLIITGHFYFLYVQQDILKKQVQDLNNQINYYQSDLKKYNDLQTKIDDITDLNQIKGNRYYISGALEDVRYAVPEKMTLDFLEINQEGTILFSGHTTDNQHIVEFIDFLSISPYYEDISVDQLERNEEMSFEISANITSK